MSIAIQRLINNLSSKQITAIKIISELVPNFRLSGSASMVYHGYIDRQINDLDFEIPHIKVLDGLKKGFKLKHDSDSELIISDHMPPHRNTELVQASTEINGVNVCFFVADSNNCTGIDLYNTWVNIAWVDNAINAKRKYIKRLNNLNNRTPRQEYLLKKHSADLLAFSDGNNDLPF